MHTYTDWVISGWDRKRNSTAMNHCFSKSSWILNNFTGEPEVPTNLTKSSYLIFSFTCVKNLYCEEYNASPYNYLPPTLQKQNQIFLILKIFAILLIHGLFKHPNLWGEKPINSFVSIILKSQPIIYYLVFLTSIRKKVVLQIFLSFSSTLT